MTTGYDCGYNTSAMYVRVISQKAKSGHVRKYTQIVKSIRRADGTPTNKVVAHLGAYDPVLTANLKAAFKAAGSGRRLEPSASGSRELFVDLEISENLTYLPAALVSHFFRGFGIDDLINDHLAQPPRAASTATVLEALVAHRCVEPGSKLAFQGWIKRVAANEVFGVTPARLNNTRVHRALDELAGIEDSLQEGIANKIIAAGHPRLLYLDLTDTWFEAGGGPLARRGRTKQGHRSKWKIHIALMVNEQGLPIRWRLLPGALSETTVLPEWLQHVKERSCFDEAILIFDRGMPSAENFQKLVGDESLKGDDGGHLFLTSVKADMIAAYAGIDHSALDDLQNLPDETLRDEMVAACAAVGMEHFAAETYARDLGVVTPSKPRAKRSAQPPRMRMYLYFNREIQQAKRTGRQEKIAKVYRFVADLNRELQHAQQPRKAEPTRRKVTRMLEKLKLVELFKLELTPFSIKGRTKQIDSQQVTVTLRDDIARNMRRYDGISLLVGHPKLNMTLQEAVTAYRQKNVVEADFRTIKSVLKLRPTFHWTEEKIRSHVTICVLALLIERLIEEKLNQNRAPLNDYPGSAEALLSHFQEVSIDRLRIDGRARTARTEAGDYTNMLLEALGAKALLDAFPATLKIPVKTL